MEIRCAVPDEGLNFTMNWEESIFPSIGDAFYLTHFLNEEDLLSLRVRKRKREMEETGSSIYPGMIYEQGIKAAIEWPVGDIDNHPINE